MECHTRESATLRLRLRLRLGEVPRRTGVTVCNELRFFAALRMTGGVVEWMLDMGCWMALDPSRASGRLGQRMRRQDVGCGREEFASRSLH